MSSQSRHSIGVVGRSGGASYQRLDRSFEAKLLFDNALGAPSANFVTPSAYGPAIGWGWHVRMKIQVLSGENCR